MLFPNVPKYLCLKYNNRNIQAIQTENRFVYRCCACAICLLIISNFSLFPFSQLYRYADTCRANRPFHWWGLDPVSDRCFQESRRGKFHCVYY